MVCFWIFQREKSLQKGILVCQPSLYPTVGNTVGNKRHKTDKQKSGSGSSQEEPNIHRDVMDEMNFRGRIPSTKPSFINVLKGTLCLLWDVPGKEPGGELATTNWRPRSGPV